MKNYFLLFKQIFSISLFLLTCSFSFGQILHSSTDSVIVTNDGAAQDLAAGFHFSPKQDLYVAKFGKRVPANGTYSWVLWDYDTKTKIYQQNSHANSPGNYVYEDVTSRIPLVLKAGTEYAFILYGIGSTSAYQGNTSQIGEHLNYFDTHFSSRCDTNTFPSQQKGNFHWGTADFLYSLTPINKGMNDATVLSVDSPSTFCAGMQDVYATIANFGYNQIDSVDIYWEFNGTLQSVIEYKQLLDTLDGNNPHTAQIFLGSEMFADGVPNSIKIWTSNPNGVTDTVNIGDTLEVIKKAALSGNISIDASQPQSSTNYPSFSSLASDLNNFGVCGPLNVTVAPGTYTDYFYLSDVPGSSSSNTITIDGQDSSSVILKHVGKEPYATVSLNGSKYVSIQNMTIEKWSLVGGSSIIISGDAEYNTISNNILTVDTTSTNREVVNVVFSGTPNGIGSGVNNYNTIQNNIINGGYYGIYMDGSITVYGNSTKLSTRNRILNNEMRNQYSHGIDISFSDSTEVIGNNIELLRNTNCRGVEIWNSNNSLINKNFINAQNGYGIYYLNSPSYTIAPANRRIQISNNMIISGRIGLMCNYMTNVDIFHNSISSLGSDPAAYISRSDSGLDIRNNIFSAVSAVAFETNSPHGIFYRFDNNAFYSESNDLIYITNTAYSDLADYHTDHPFFNVSSIEEKPDFVDPNADLHLFSSAYGNDIGDNSVNITKDIDGDDRPFAGSSTVDIGADEFEPPVCFAPENAIAYNAALDSITLSWEGGSGSTFQYEIVLKGQDQDPANVVTTNMDSLRVGDLDPSTAYEFYVRQICASGDTSPWIRPIEFYSKFIVSFFEDFETFNNGLIKNWTSSTTSDPLWESGTQSNYPGNTGPDMDHTIGAGGIFAYLNGERTVGSSQLISPLIATDTNEVLELSFWYHMYGADMGVLDVYVDTNGVVPNFITSISGPQQASGSAPWKKFSTYLVGYDGQDLQLRFEGMKGNGRFSAMAIDDVSLEIVPSLDVGLVELMNHPICAGSYTPIVSLKNFGQEDVDSVKIYWEVNGALDSMMYNATTLSLGDEVQLSLNPISLSGTSIYDIQFYTSRPNSMADLFNANDTLKFENVKTGISGTYTIDASQAATISNYTSFASAIADLHAFGVCGPTTFNVAPGTYTEAIRINEILGANSTNTITFDGGSAASTTISHDGSAAYATITLDGTNYISFNNFKIEFTGSAGATVLFAYDANYNTISNSELIVDSISSDRQLNNIAFSGNDFSVSAGATADYNTIKNNTINGGYIGINIIGAANSILINNKITNNKILNNYNIGIQAFYHDSVEIIGNRIIPNPANANNYGARVWYSNNSQINKNYIHAVNAIYCYRKNTSANRRIEINNNMVISEGVGIFVGNTDSVDIFHNSVLAYGSNNAIQLYNLSEIDVRNNIFSSEGGIALITEGTISFNNFDNNLFNTGGATLLEITGVGFADLASYQIFSGYNVLSIEGDPQFVSKTDLHIHGTVVNDKGATTAVAEDIDGDPRPISGATNVDIGADEFNPPSCPPLVGPGATNIGTNAAEIYWTGMGNEFEYQYGVLGFAIGSPTGDSIILNDTATLVGLNSSTAYEFYVREICRATDTSTWTGPFSFITACTPVTNYPYEESFESGNAGWFTEGINNSWELGVPNNVIIDRASDGSNAWVTGLESNYSDDESSYVLSICFDFSNLDYPSIEMDVFWNSQFSWDGANIQVSIDGGSSWSNVGSFGDPDNWYTDNSINAAPGGSQEGWTGANSSADGSGKWLRAKHELYSLGGLPDVLLRVSFASNNYSVDEGFAFDNIWIGDRPDISASVTALIDPAGAICTGTYSPMVEVSNTGKDTIHSVKVLYSVNGVLDSVLYTGTIVPFGSQNVSLNSLTFNSGVNYDMHIYTKDPNGGMDDLSSDDSLSLIGFQTGLDGTYSIDASLPASNTNFTSFSAAAAALGNNGVCGAVYITAAPGVYNESVTLNEIKGASSVNTITFDGMDSSTTKLFHGGGTYATFTLDGADYVRLKNLGIETTHDSYGATVLLKDADHNTISNCHLRVRNTIDYGDMMNVIFSGSTAIESANSNSNYNTISNNYIDGGNYGIWMQGDPSNVNVGNKILGNKMDNIFNYGIDARIQDSLEIIENTILVLLSNNNNHGVRMAYSTNSLIHGNYIHVNEYGFTYSNNNTYAPANRDIEFINNMIICENGPGLSLSSTTGVIVLHNSISAYEEAFGIPNSTTLDVRNNIFQSAYGYAVESNRPSSIFTFMDNNAYYTQGPNLLRISNVDYVDLASFQTAAPAYNTASIEGDPQFISATDLHINGSFVNDKGDNTAGVALDIDGDVRPMPASTTVDIGADEFDAPSCPAPLNLSTLDPAPDSITLEWDGIGRDFEYEIVEFRGAQGTGTIASVTSNSVRAGGLSDYTVYDYYVREICRSGDTSAWAGPFSFITLKEINDLGIASLVQPVEISEGCYSTAEDIEFAIINSGNTSVDFSVDSADLRLEVTGAAAQSFAISINDNTLNNGQPLQIGDTLFVPMGTLDMTSVGDYTFSSTLEFNLDTFLNNNLDTTIVSNSSSGGTLSSGSNVCGSGTISIHATNAMGDLQWQGLVAGTFMDEIGADSTSYEVFVDSTTTFRLIACGVAYSDTLTINPDVVPAIPSTTNDTAIVFCGDSGTAVLTASTTVSGTISWYPDTAKTTIISTGSTYNYGLNTSTQSATTIYSDTFYVSVEDGVNGCESELAMVTGAVICTVGEEEIGSSTSSLLIYPNPSKGIFNLMGRNVEEGLEVSIYNTNGKMVYQMDSKVSNNFNKQIDLSGLSKGIYFIKLQGTQSFEMRKIVIH